MEASINKVFMESKAVYLVAWLLDVFLIIYGKEELAEMWYMYLLQIHFCSAK